MENRYYTEGNYETIDLIEDIMSRDNIPPIQAHAIAEAQRYIGRAGKKTPDWRRDIFKAMNYLHRALTGNWVDSPKFTKFQSNLELSGTSGGVSERADLKQAVKQHPNQPHYPDCL